jgi:hypothetical protein
LNLVDDIYFAERNEAKDYESHEDSKELGHGSEGNAGTPLWLSIKQHKELGTKFKNWSIPSSTSSKLAKEHFTEGAYNSDLLNPIDFFALQGYTNGSTNSIVVSPELDCYII